MMINRWGKHFFWVICFFLLFVSNAQTDADSGTNDSIRAQMVFPGLNWQTATPESQNVDATSLESAMDYLRSQTDYTDKIIVIRNGYMIWSYGNINDRVPVGSCTKIFTSSVMGLLCDEGKLSPDTLAKDKAPILGSAYPGVKLRHFASMTSGYDAEGHASWSKMDGSPTPWVPTSPMFGPGQAYLYWDDAANMMGYVLTKTAQETMLSLFIRKIGVLIGMSNWDWGFYGYSVDNQFPLNGGAGHTGTGVDISAGDLARMGHLYVNDGVWNNQRLLSSSWISQATSVQVPSATPMFKDTPYYNPAMHSSHMDIDGRGVYGFHWWVNGKKPDGINLMPDAPGGAYYRDGGKDNFLVVVPEWDMVIVRLGTYEDKIPVSEEAGVWNTVLKTIGEGLIPPSVCTEVGGDVVSNTVWADQGSPYFVSSTIVVKSGVTLTVTSDVVVLLQDGAKLGSESNGRIHFNGSNISVIPYDGRCE